MMRRLEGDVINVFSCLIGGHGGVSNRLFLEFHSRRTRCNGTELHLQRMVKDQKKGLDWLGTTALTNIQHLSWPCYEQVRGPSDPMVSSLT